MLGRYLCRVVHVVGVRERCWSLRETSLELHENVCVLFAPPRPSLKSSKLQRSARRAQRHAGEINDSCESVRRYER